MPEDVVGKALEWIIGTFDSVDLGKMLPQDFQEVPRAAKLDAIECLGKAVPRHIGNEAAIGELLDGGLQLVVRMVLNNLFRDVEHAAIG